LPELSIIVTAPAASAEKHRIGFCGEKVIAAVAFVMGMHRAAEGWLRLGMSGISSVGTVMRRPWRRFA
jgi:hypothetical protein